MKSILRRLLILLAIAPALAACAVSASPVSGRKRAYAYTWDQEIRLGRQADREIVDQFGEYPDEELEAYVRRVGEAVLATSHLRRPEALPEYRATKFTFRVLDTEIVNAFALPGGFVYVTRGLLAHLDNEAQLAVVLGHEVAHIAARHSAQDAFESTLLMVTLTGAGLIGDEMGGVAEGAIEVGGIAAQLMLFRYSRDDERESDRLGVEYAVLAGYRAAEGAEFFSALERMQVRGGWFPAFLSTHPDPGRREWTVTQMAAEWAARGVDGQRVEADAYLQHLDGMILGEDPREGFVEDGVFYHPGGAFRFPLPDGWVLTREGRKIQFLPEEVNPLEETAVEVEFGAHSRHPSAGVAAAEFIRENELSGARTYTTEMNGFAGARVEGGMGEEDGPHYTVLGYWLESNGEVRRFVGIGDAARAEELEHAVGVMTRGFRALEDESILSMEPAYLALVPVREDAPFHTFVPEESLPYGMEMDDLAILNGVGPEDVVPAGTILKLPR